MIMWNVSEALLAELAQVYGVKITIAHSGFALQSDSELREVSEPEAETQAREIAEYTAWLTDSAYGQADLGTRWTISGGEMD